MRKTLLLLTLAPLAAMAQTQNLNYVKKTAYKQATATPIGNPDAAQAAVTVTYLDGLGRPLQTLAKKQGTENTTMVSALGYDAFGRQVTDYLPYPIGEDGDFDPDAIDRCFNFFNDPYRAPVTTKFPYGQKVYENSPFDRVLEQSAPGESWALPENGPGHTIKYDYLTNKSSEVRRYAAPLATDGSAQLSENGFHAKNTLYKNVVKDENWTQDNDHTTQEFRNSMGQVVLKRTFEAEQAHDTYYVYDTFGNLTFVIPPKAVGDTANPEVVSGLCYQYRYDKRNRMIGKKLPGAGWQYMVYDQLDRLRLTGPVRNPFQDGQSMEHYGTTGWLFSKYDAFGRTVETGYYYSQGEPGWAMQEQLTNLVNMPKELYEDPTRTATALPDGSAHYTNLSFPVEAFLLLTVNYYDDYRFCSPMPDFTSAIMGDQTVAYNNTTLLPRGLATGSWVRLVDASDAADAEVSYTLYDDQARPIRTVKQNAFGGVTRTESRYGFFRLLETATFHERTAGSADAVSTREAFEYSPNEQLVARTHRIGNMAIEPLAITHYDILGRLSTKAVGQLGGSRLQQMDFTYNIRGWLSGINDPNAGMRPHTDADDLFRFYLSYDAVTDAPNAGVVPLYNGNISETRWSSATDGHTLRKYSYEYDALNRLLEGHYSKPGVGSNNQNYNERLGYDKNGNILWLQRLGDSDAPNFGNVIDDLTYSYGDGSNQLKKVMDATNDPSGFADDSDGVTDSGDDYAYDSFGNMTSDENKGITSIRYNHLNLPTEIQFASGNFILYKYNALGQKVYKRTREAGVYTTIDYLDGFQYQNGILQFFPTVEGYVRCTKVGSSNFFNYVYQYRDHLGNIRMNFAVDPETGELKTLEENHYYPFGLKHMNYSNGKLEFKELNANVVLRAAAAPGNNAKPLGYNYKYQSQEWQDELGLNWYSFRWRNSDPAIGRFMNIDPLAEDYPHNSPYAFAENRVVDGRELEGLEWASSTSSDGKTVNLTLNVRVVNNTSNNLTNAQVAALAGERARMLTSTIGGTDAQGRNVNVIVNQSNDATMVWEYNTVLTAKGVKDLVGKSPEYIDTVLGGADGITDEIGNTQNNRTQVNVGPPLIPYSDKTGLPDFENKDSRSSAARAGSHEDGHTLGLRHDNDSKNPNAKEQSKDRNNLMNNNDARGRNISKQQRSQVIKLIEEQQN